MYPVLLFNTYIIVPGSSLSLQVGFRRLIMGSESTEERGNTPQPPPSQLRTSHIESDDLPAPPQPIAEKWIHYHLENVNRSPRLSDQAEGRLNIEKENIESDKPGRDLTQNEEAEESGEIKRHSKWKIFVQIFVWLLFTA